MCKIFCFNISSGSGFVFLFFLRLFFPECRLDSPWISFEASTSNAEHLYFQLTYPCPNCGWVSIVFCAWNDYYHHKYKYKWIHFLILSSKFFQISGFFTQNYFVFSWPVFVSDRKIVVFGFLFSENSKISVFVFPVIDVGWCWFKMRTWAPKS